MASSEAYRLPAGAARSGPLLGTRGRDFPGKYHLRTLGGRRGADLATIKIGHVALLVK